MLLGFCIISNLVWACITIFLNESWYRECTRIIEEGKDTELEINAKWYELLTESKRAAEKAKDDREVTNIEEE